MNEQTNIGKKLNYFGKQVTVLDENKTHFLVQFESGTKIATPRSTFDL